MTRFSSPSSRLSLLVPLLASLFALPSAAWATDYYVSPSGNDANPGTAALPWRQISKAISVVAAGDTVYIADGTYNGALVITKTGTAVAPITFKAQGTGAIVTPGGTDTIFITFSSYVVIDGLRSFNATRAGLRIDASDHVTVKNCVFGDNARWGIFTDFSDYVLLEGNTCYNSGLEHGIYHSNSGDYPTIRGNILYGNNACGLHMNGDISMGGDGTISYALVENNIIYNNGVAGGSGINGDGVNNSTIRNNLLYNNHASGISLYQIDGGGPSINNTVCNNTVDQASNGRWCLNMVNGATGTTVFNNIFLTHHATRGSLHFESAADLVGLSCNFNILTTINNCVTTDDDATYKTFAQWQAMGYDANSVAATHANVFVDWTTDDFHLKAGSPAIDTGTPSLASKSAPTTDYEAGLRPTDAGYDKGADEFNAVGGGGGGGGGGGTTPSSGGGKKKRCGLTGMEVPLILGLLWLARRRA